jgi:predicted ATP-grasp superfamily ATP-dependent carboligase
MPSGGPLAELHFLEHLAAEGTTAGWTLIPTNDHGAELIARHRRRLAKDFIVSVPEWETLRWAHDKRLTYALADRVGVDHPWTLAPASETELARATGHFPVIVKPAFKPAINALTSAKAWRADDARSLVEAYRAACELVPSEAVLIQELIAGDGVSQLSYAALAVDGRPVASLCARRLRQWPITIGRSSTYVETIEAPDIEQAAELLIDAMHFTGLLEIEFKRDPSSGTLKLLDINPRVWGWHGIGPAAGVDFPYLLWRALHMEPVVPVRGAPGVRWMRLTTDLAVVLKEIIRGRLSIGSYLRSFRPPVESAIFAWDDPVPGLLDVPQFLHLIVGRGGL